MIQLNDVCKSFQQGDESVEALSHISLEIKQGECVVLKGASGSGKSTLLSLIAGIAKPQSGEVRVLDKTISMMPDAFSAAFRRENIGFIFQKFHLISTLSVGENIIAPLIPQKLSYAILEQKAQAVMEQFNIASKAKRRVTLLSGGEQQRVAIARALVNEPSLILADEPTANLDEKLSLELIAYLGALKVKGVTLLIATHDPLFFDLPFVDRIVEIKNGKIVHNESLS